jgi:hypothetical protein
LGCRASITFSKRSKIPNIPDHEDLLNWYGGNFDPSDLDDDAIKKRFACLTPRKKRKAA